MNLHSLSPIAAAAAFACLPAPAVAQNLGGVFGPVVKEGHASAQYRAGYEPDAERFGQRVHYQQAVSPDLMLRGVLQMRENTRGGIDFDNIGAEAFLQLSDDDAPWRTGLRFDARIRDDDRAHTLGVNWTNEWSVNEKVRTRAVLLTSVQAGDNAQSGVFLQTRGQVNYALRSGRAVGLDVFSAYGSTDDFADFEDQSHEAGPYISTPVSNKWSLRASMLFGLTRGSPDSNLKLWLGRNF